MKNLTKYFLLFTTAACGCIAVRFRVFPLSPQNTQTLVYVLCAVMAITMLLMFNECFGPKAREIELGEELLLGSILYFMKELDDQDHLSSDYSFVDILSVVGAILDRLADHDGALGSELLVRALDLREENSSIRECGAWSFHRVMDYFEGEMPESSKTSLVANTDPNILEILQAWHHKNA